MGLRATLKRILSGKTLQDVELEYLIKHGLQIGKDCTINAGCTIDSGWPWLISIGNQVTLSSNVTILAHDASSNVVRCGTKLGRVHIGNNVFIGTGSIITCNTRIGDNVIVGAGSVVTHDLPSNGVYAGAPAERICSIDEYRNKNYALRKTRPTFDHIHPWNEWREASEEEREHMKQALVDGIGYI